MSKDLTEDFWNDCINNQIVTHLENNNPYKKFSKICGRNNNSRKLKTNNKNIMNLYSFQEPHQKTKNNNSKNQYKSKTNENPNFSKIYKQHPLLHPNNIYSKEDKEYKKRQKNALLRCLGLYAYGLEVRKEKLLNDENTKKERLKEEILPCTFKPKISKYSSLKKARFLTDVTNKNKYKKKDKNNLTNEYKITTISSYDNGATKKDTKLRKNLSVEEEKSDRIDKIDDECTFQPKINKRNLKTIFVKKKSLSNETHNDQFFIRYSKAREDYMTKKMNQLSTKDESYYTMLTLFNGFSNKNKRNKKVHYWMNEYKNGGMNYNKKTITAEQNIIQSLRNELLGIDLNDDE